MSDTPRTDAAAKAIGNLAAQYKFGDIPAHEFTEDANKAMDDLCTIERELAAAKAEVARLREAATRICHEHDQLLELAYRFQSLFQKGLQDVVPVWIRPVVEELWETTETRIEFVEKRQEQDAARAGKDSL